MAVMSFFKRKIKAYLHIVLSWQIPLWLSEPNPLHPPFPWPSSPSSSSRLSALAPCGTANSFFFAAAAALDAAACRSRRRRTRQLCGGAE
jgi:hypothetical protein